MVTKQAFTQVEQAENELKDYFSEIEKTTYYNQKKVCLSLQNHHVSQRHFSPSTGYAYDDQGRDCLDKVFAEVFGTEDALVRTHWVSGTHVISDALYAMLRPKSTLIAVTGKPYDTIDDVIGYKNESDFSLKSLYNIHYIQIELINEAKINYSALKEALNENKGHKVVYIQKSRGYAWRQALSVKDIEEVVAMAKSIDPNIDVLVDNCYGEFVEKIEPGDVGADLVVGSLIKNPGGGIAPTGAYAAGNYKAIEKMEKRLTSPAIGREVGSNPYGYRTFFQGLFMAPSVVEASIKSAALFSKVFETLGYPVMPKPFDSRFDITQSIQLADENLVVEFCNIVQSCSPIDSFVSTEPWEMPGYDHKVVMAAGTFIEGASIELSADAPITKPFSVYLQGGLTYAHCKYCVTSILKKFLQRSE